MLWTRQRQRPNQQRNVLDLLLLQALLVLLLAGILCRHESQAFIMTTVPKSRAGQRKVATVTSSSLHLAAFHDIADAVVDVATTTATASSSLSLSFAQLLPTTAELGSSGTTLADWLYQAQSTAGDLAQAALQNGSGDHHFNVWVSLPVMYVAGLLTSVSPCVWGLLPLTMSYISTAAGERQDQKTTLPTLAFAAGLALVFCSLGIAAAQLGGVVFGSSSSSSDGIFHWMTLVSHGICLLMGFKLLELIQIPLLSWDVTQWNVFRNNNNNNKEPILIDATGQILNTAPSSQQSSASAERGSLVRTFLLGGSSALVASPCATPVLTSILAQVAAEHNPVWGAAWLLGYTLGYATPLLWIAATGGQALVTLKQDRSSSNRWFRNVLAPWVTPVTGGILLWYGTTGLLTGLLGDPSLAALAPILE